MISIENVPQSSMDLIRLILINQMNLRQDRVSIYDEKWKIPPTDDMFITIEYRNGRTLGNNNYFINNAGDPAPSEVQVVNMLEKIVVGVFSRTREAMMRKEEVLMSIMSQYSQLFQESFGFKIARAGEIDDLSVLEGAAMLKRYDIELSVYAWYTRTVVPGYLIPPFTLQVIANDRGTGEIKQNVIQLTTLPI